MRTTAESPYVLVLDLIEEEGEMYAEYLRAAGFHVELYLRPADVFESVEHRRPDVVVTRLRQATPGITGIDVVRRLKASATARNVPIVMITSSMLPGDRQAALEAKCDAYMVLPVTPDRLAFEIRRLLTGEPQGA